MTRATLRLYLGAAPGVGKTYAMLNEGWRRKERGTDVVVGWVQDHGRPQTDAQIRDLEVFPRRTVEYRGRTFEEMDLDGLLGRRPELVLVDELAHANVPGSSHAKRWQDVEELVDAGIHVVSTVNLQHLESLNDVVERITGVVQRETVPDRIVRSADQLELVDMTPEALRRRLAHGNVYPAERIDAALGNYFRAGNLTALRELTLLWMADRVDEELSSYRERHGIADPWETKERVVVSLTGAPGSATLIRRSARMAMRAKAELVGVHVRTDEGLSGTGDRDLPQHRALLEDLGGRFVEVVGADVAPALVQVARAENATQLVLGATQRSRWSELVRGSIVNAVIREAAGALDVHVIATRSDGDTRGLPTAGPERTGEEGPPRPADAHPRHPLHSPLPARRQVAALLVGAIGFPLLTLVLTATRTHVELATVLSSYLFVVVVVASTGGLWPAVAAAVAGFLLSNYFFTPPLYTFTISDIGNILALVLFLVIAVVVSSLVDAAARRSAAASRARADARMLARVAGRLVSPGPDLLPELLDELVVAFRLDAAAVLSVGTAADHSADLSADLSADRRAGGPAHPAPATPIGPLPGAAPHQPGPWTIVVAAGAHPPSRPEEGSIALPLTDHEILVLRGPDATAEDRYILAAFAAQLATALLSHRLHAGAAEAESLARANQLRSALLAAVSHDLRTPLASIKAAASSLLSEQLSFGPEETGILLHTIDDGSDHLNSLVENLLDMSRLETGSVEVLTRATDVGELIDAAVASLGTGAGRVTVADMVELPPVETDPVLVERVVANLVDNALVHGGTDVGVQAGAIAGRVDIRVVDRGPGIPRDQRWRVFQPFQRLGDAPGGSGVGLGLAVCRGFIEAVGGDLEIEDTPGGGCTMVVRLTAAGGGDPEAGTVRPAEARP